MKKVSIVGFGRFGRTLYRLLSGSFEVILYDKGGEVFKGLKTEKNTRIANTVGEIYESDTIFFCTPISTFESLIASHKKYFNENHLLVDVLSVKEWPQYVFKKHLKGLKTRALLTHPMFGPDSSRDGFSGLRIVLDRFTCTKDEYKFWKDFFAGKGLNVIELSPKKHDAFAARSQGVTHFLGRLLSQYGFKDTPIDTKGAEYLYKVMEQTCNDTWELFNSLQVYNKYSKSMRLNIGKAYDHLFNKLLPKRVSLEYLVFGIQGGVGSFNEQAIMSHIKANNIKNYKIKYLYTSEKVLRNVYEGNVDFGLFATHNSLGGIVAESVLAMSRYNFNIVQDISIPIQHFLMKRKDVKMSDIKKIMAHSQVFKQCKNNLSKKFPKLIQETGSGDLVDTAKSAQALSQNKIPKTVAILGPKELSDLYDLEIVAENLQDNDINNTSFLLVTR